MPTIIPLRDGVRDRPRHLDRLTLREFTIGDIVALAFLDMGKLPDAMKLIARLSGEPVETLSWLTQDDVHAALLGLSEHIKNFENRGRG